MRLQIRSPLNSWNIPIRTRLKAVQTNKILLSELLVLGFFWPFGAFIVSCYSFRERSAQIFMYLYFILYGMTFVFGSESTDAVRIYESFNYMSKLPFSGFFTIFSGLYSSDDSKGDVFLPFLFFIVSRFSTSMSALYGTLCAIYGFFFFKFFSSLVSVIPSKRRTYYYHIVFLVLCSLYIRYSAVNGVRFWTATFIYVYSIIQYVYFQKHKFVFLILLSGLVHFGFLPAIAIFMIYVAIHRWPILSYIYLGFCVTISLAAPNLLVLLDFLKTFDITPAEKMINSYGSKNALEGIATKSMEKKWFLNLYQPLAYWFCVISIPIAKFAMKLKFDENTKRFYFFTLIFFSSLLLFKDIPTLGFRYTEIFILLALSCLFFISVKNRGLKIGILSIAAIVCVSLAIIVGLRIAKDTTSALMVISNFPYMVYAIITNTYSDFRL